MTNKEIKELNQELKIKKIDGYKFKETEKSYYICSGYALHHELFGWVKFESDNTPYIPAGGKKALQNILDAGGFNSFEGMEFVYNMK